MGSALGGDGACQNGGPLTGTLPADLAAAFEAGGEMGARLRDFDWSSAGLGTPDTWPAPLRRAITTMLASGNQIVLFWGDDHLAFYNDAYLPTIGSKHPHALGQPARRHWAELWHVLEPLFTGVRRSGQAYKGTDHPFLLERHGFLEEVYFDISYDPLWGVDGAVDGVFCIVNETTERVVGARRLRLLAELTTRLTGLDEGAELGRRVVEVLDRYRDDIPFALLYLLDGAGGPELAGCSGLDRSTVTALPGAVALPAALTGVLAGGPARPAAAADFVAQPPTAAAAEVLVLPFSAGTGPGGALVTGISRRLAMTPEYRGFFDLLAAQLSTAVTNQRAYAHERTRAAELAELDRAKTNFFANVSHEFRTPLTLILSPIEEALAEPDPSPACRERFELMHRNALRLLKLVNTVLDFSQLESGRLLARYRPTDLADYTVRLASTFRSATERVGLRLLVDCPPLPEPVFVDREMWEKIVLNLISNAVKFTFQGEITIRLRAVDGAARLEVADTGVGIEPAELPLIFDRFHRVPGTRARTQEGTGIGLALARELVEMHGGTVAVRSRVDEGSVFTVTVPFGSGHLPTERVIVDADPLAGGDLAEQYLQETTRWNGPGTADAAAAGTEVVRSDGRHLTGNGASLTAEDAVNGPRRGRVLVADDNADLREHLRRLLSPYWDVICAPDGLVAFDTAVSAPFDLILTDMMMPRLDGAGLVRKLRADPRTRHVPIVILTARAGAGEAVEGLSVGADDYLIKPFSGVELVARVRSNVELGQLRGQIIRQLRSLADAAVAVNTARSTAEVLEVAARHALDLVQAGRVVASVPGARYEADGGGRSPEDPSVVTPLVGTSGDQLGELRVWPREVGSSDAEQAALAQFARLVGVRLDNARLYEAEHRIATTLQHSLLPQVLPQPPGTIITSRYLPGNTDVEVGGDWYDVITVEDGQLVLVIGDVVGKGVPAAAAMGQLRNALRAYVLEGFAPGQALTRLNRLVNSAGERSFATVVCVWLDPGTGSVRYASAGHPSPMTIGPDAGVSFLHDRALGPPIGALSRTRYETAETTLEPGTRLLLYTDGLIEDRRQGIDAGLAQLRADATEPCEHIDDLVDLMLDRVVRRPRRDDVAVLGLELTEINRFALRLPADPTRLSLLRRRLEDFLLAHGVAEPDMFDLTVAVSEAAANAIEHPVAPTEPVITVEVTVEGDTVVATVRDTGRWREATGAGFRGRGLALIGALAELTVSRTDEGTEVTLRRRLTR